MRKKKSEQSKTENVQQGKLREKISIYIARSPEKAILLAILLFNVIFFCLSALVISWLTPQKEMGFWQSAYGTITMILDAGCISNVVADVGTAGVALIVTCLVIVFIGMITFTGAVIGYISNIISSYISSANSGNVSLKISGHTVILNWNTRASEIINDLLYTGQKEQVVVLTMSDKDTVRREINDRISDTLRRENMATTQYSGIKGWFARINQRNEMKNTVTVILRNGDIYSTKQLNDICIDKAKTIIILGKDTQGSICKYEKQERTEEAESGNYNTVKALIQVADMTAAESSADDQKIVVEVEDDWTLNLIERIICHKEKIGKCHIIPVPVNRVLGQILAQFCVVPELNRIYSELFSNKGAFLDSMPIEEGYTIGDETMYMGKYLETHNEAVPLCFMDSKEGLHGFFMVDGHKVMQRKSSVSKSELTVELNPNFRLRKKNIIILGHNSKMDAIIAGFDAIRNEWGGKNGEDIFNILIIDDEASLKKHDFYRDIPYIAEPIVAEVFDQEKIYAAIRSFITDCEGDTDILVLSDDKAIRDDIDAKVLTYLIYVNDILASGIAGKPSVTEQSIDVIVEVLNPKNIDVVRSYNVKNVVMSNRYISKMITQIGDKEAIYELYNDILTYDIASADDTQKYESKELYAKQVSDFLCTLPPKCTAQELIRAIFNAGPSDNKSYCLGYVRNDTEVVFFTGCQADMQVELLPSDKLIIFANH